MNTFAGAFRILVYHFIWLPNICMKLIGFPNFFRCQLFSDAVMRRKKMVRVIGCMNFLVMRVHNPISDPAGFLTCDEHIKTNLYWINQQIWRHWIDTLSLDVSVHYIICQPLSPNNSKWCDQDGCLHFYWSTCTEARWRTRFRITHRIVSTPWRSRKSFNRFDIIKTHNTLQMNRGRKKWERESEWERWAVQIKVEDEAKSSAANGLSQQCTANRHTVWPRTV